MPYSISRSPTGRLGLLNSSRFVQPNEGKTMNRALQHPVNQNAQTIATRFRLSWLVLNRCASLSSLDCAVPLCAAQHIRALRYFHPYLPR